MTHQLVILGAFAVLLVLEEAGRTGPAARLGLRRLAVNWGLGLANFALMAALAFNATVLAWAAGAGLIGAWPIAGLAVLLLARSFSAYWLHRLFHAVPQLWRIHRVHHCDPALDTSSGLRNHPFEALAAAATGAAVTLALGASVAQAVAVDAILFVAALWQHAAIALPRRVEVLLEPLIITPRLHRTHHAPERAVHDSNYGDLFSLWDRLFGTLREPAAPSAPVGLIGDGPEPESLVRQLLAPFHR